MRIVLSGQGRLVEALGSYSYVPTGSIFDVDDGLVGLCAEQTATSPITVPMSHEHKFVFRIVYEHTAPAALPFGFPVLNYGGRWGEML